MFSIVCKKGKTVRRFSVLGENCLIVFIVSLISLVMIINVLCPLDNTYFSIWGVFYAFQTQLINIKS